ncbi:hypothetical protein GF312_06595 [Candidatus Poribacteria bacterium]|nr:hypothetical protein [Candidatus Poribacteria bacterium]
MLKTLLRWRLKKIKSGDENSRLKAAKKLSKARDIRAVEPLINMLNDESNEVKATAAAILGYIGDRRAIQPLIAVSDDYDAGVQSSANMALGMIMDMHSDAKLTSLLMNTKDESSREEIQNKLTALGNEWLNKLQTT